MQRHAHQSNRFLCRTRILQPRNQYECSFRLSAPSSFLCLQSWPGANASTKHIQFLQFRYFSRSACNTDASGNKRAKTPDRDQAGSDRHDKQAPVSPEASKSIFVRNLPFDTNAEDLEDEFSRVGGPVTSAHIVRDLSTLKSHGCAFVNFLEAQGAAVTLRLDGQLSIGGRVVRIRSVKTQLGKRLGPKRIHKPSSTLFIGNAGLSMTADELKSHFIRYGHVKKVHISGGTGMASKNFAHVEFGDVETASKAYRDVDAWFLSGRNLRLDYAKPPKRKTSANATRRSGLARVGQNHLGR